MSLKERIVDAKAIPLLLTLLDRTTPCSTTTRLNATAALRSLSLSESARKVIVTEGGVKQLTGMLQGDSEECQEQVGGGEVGVVNDSSSGCNECIVK